MSNDAYYNQGVDMQNLMGDLGVQAEEDKLFREAQEKARLYAESQMGEVWNRKDHHKVVVFYNYMVQYLIETYVLKHKPQ